MGSDGDGIGKVGWEMELSRVGHGPPGENGQLRREPEFRECAVLSGGGD